MQAAIAEARAGLAEGGIPIGSVLVHQGVILGRGHNRRIQKGSPILHGDSVRPSVGRCAPPARSTSAAWRPSGFASA